MCRSIKMISRTGKYALRILGYLAERPSEWVLGKDIATATGIPANYLLKILNQLSKHGFVLSQKGWGGGFRLRDEAREIRIESALALFEGPFNQRECLFGLASCESDDPCPLHDAWETIRRSYTDMLQATTVGDLASRRIK
jgi:Rrf2 family transcriptional regulator, iron-sulfur cluster assembly transcription factor